MGLECARESERGGEDLKKSKGAGIDPRLIPNVVGHHSTSLPFGWALPSQLRTVLRAIFSVTRSFRGHGVKLPLIGIA